MTNEPSRQVNFMEPTATLNFAAILSYLAAISAGLDSFLFWKIYLAPAFKYFI